MAITVRAQQREGAEAGLPRAGRAHDGGPESAATGGGLPVRPGEAAMVKEIITHGWAFAPVPNETNSFGLNAVLPDGEDWVILQDEDPFFDHEAARPYAMLDW